MTKRADAHRVGAIVPEDYEYVLSYSLATTDDGWPVPSYRVNCELDRRVLDEKGALISNGQHDEHGRCCVVGLFHVAKVCFASHGSTGKCTICGAAFVYGDVWVHTPTGEHINVGHTCAEKYSMLADRGDFDAGLEALKRATAATRLAEMNRKERQAFLDDHPGLAEALEVDHYIVKDIAARFRQYRSLSEKQVALVMKLSNETKNPAPAEVHVPAPEGRVTVRGKVLSVKVADSDFGGYKMTVKVETPAGSWLAWGTCPRNILDAAPGTHIASLKGAEVEFSAQLKRGRDAHFALFTRPTKSCVIAIPVE